jgi:hypothetical protein
MVQTELWGLRHFSFYIQQPKENKIHFEHNRWYIIIIKGEVNIMSFMLKEHLL